MSHPSNPLLTDLYQLAMVQAYHERGMTGPAVFELFVRTLPQRRGFLMAAGLDQALDYLESLQFDGRDIDDLRRTGLFPSGFLDWLADFRFTGDVDAMPEGTVFFPDEPILRVHAPLPQAQFVETRLINLVHFQTCVASKAARMVLAAPGKAMVDFGLRRAHGAEAGLLAARASYLAGFTGTATVEAGLRFRIPLYGTMAHSFIEACDTEIQAFQRFARSRPDGLVLLIDTYDTLAAARTVVRIADLLAMDGIKIRGVRIDSGDLSDLAHKVRAILDSGGLTDTIIFASGGLDEDQVAHLVQSGAPIDGFGMGTALTTSSDAAALDCAYKLQEYDRIPRRKLSSGKANWPGPKQVWRRWNLDDAMAGDTVAPLSAPQDGHPLLVPVMRQGRRVDGLPTLTQSRDRAQNQLGQLPPALKALAPFDYPVEIAPSLRDLARECDLRIRASQQTVDVT